MVDENVTAGSTILVVDDSPPNVKLLRLILGAAGYRVLEAYSGPEALSLLRREKPDAMVLDVRMPGMTGYEVCERIRQDPEFSALPVIMVTALSLVEERIKGIEAGATDFITKPFNKKELLARLHASLLMAKNGKHSMIVPLPGGVLITDLSWKILALSPLAAVLLDLTLSGMADLDFTQMLGQTERELLAAGQPLVDFRLHAHREVAARQIVVTEPGGKQILRLITLNEAGST